MSMKIVAGLGCIDDYVELVEAGADELFAGYVPGEFIKKYGRRNPINRREVIYYNVQIGSESELLILKDMISAYGVKVSIAINSLYYSKMQLQDIVRIINGLKEIGFNSFIISDIELIDCLKNIKDINIEVSGELGELNRDVIGRLNQDNIKRFIFPRQTLREEMMLLSENSNKEFEAFALNEKCHFTGAYCNSHHCDELCHLCKVPYRIPGIDSDYEEEKDVVGSTGCSLCELWKLKNAGVTHLKVVSRGNSAEMTIRDIKAMRKALDIMENADTEEEYIKIVKREIFPTGCSENCYRAKNNKNADMYIS